LVGSNRLASNPVLNWLRTARTPAYLYVAARLKTIIVELHLKNFPTQARQDFHYRKIFEYHTHLTKSFQPMRSGAIKNHVATDVVRSINSFFGCVRSEACNGQHRDAISLSRHRTEHSNPNYRRCITGYGPPHQCHPQLCVGLKSKHGTNTQGQQT
jgi:hypothetical protein